LIVVRGIRRHFESSREFSAQAHFPHMACYGGSRDGSSGYLQILRQPGASIASLGSKIGIPDLFVQLHILTLTRALRIFKPAVITAPGHFQYFTHHLDRPLFRVVFLYKEIDQRSLLEMMLKARSEEHTSELQSRENLVCRLLLEKKKDKRYHRIRHVTTK